MPENPPKEPPPKLPKKDKQDETPKLPAGTVQTERKIYRPKLPSLYLEPDLGPDLLDGYELIHKDYGNSLRKLVGPLPIRNDIILFNEALHQQEFDKNIKWGNCPVDQKDQITSLIQQHWDCFAEEGLKKHIRGFSCRVDTGTIEPVCCKPPRYGPHETEVMTKLCQQRPHRR